MVGLQLVLAFAVRDRDGGMLPPEDLHTQGELLMGALLELEQCNKDMQDPATSSDAEDGRVTVELSVTAASDADALAGALNICRTAIHTIGGSTPHWPADSGTEPRADFTPQNVQFDYV